MKIKALSKQSEGRKKILVLKRSAFRKRRRTSERWVLDSTEERFRIGVSGNKALQELQSYISGRVIAMVWF